MQISQQIVDILLVHCATDCRHQAVAMQHGCGNTLIVSRRSARQLRAQIGAWEGLGIETLVLGVGVVPFHVTNADDIAMFASLRP